MRVRFRKSNRRHKHSTYSIDAYLASNAIGNLLKLYPTAEVICKKGSRRRTRRIFITFTHLADEAHFLLLAHDGFQIENQI
jgi:hypothetical protein